MNELIMALGLAIIAEGCLYALFPDFMRRMMATALATPVPQIRTMGVIAAAFGLIILWLARNY